MTDPQRPPADGWRGLSWPSEYRSEGDKPPRLTGHFARFGVFNEIDSAIEGRFLERIEPGAFARTFKNNRDNIKLLFQHGLDQTVGQQPIGRITELRSEKAGPYYEAELFPSVPPLVMDGLRAGAYGVSYRFSVVDEDWNPKPARSPENPKALPERTIREARVFEFGPVTFPADAGADIVVRSLTDQMTPQPVAPSSEPAAEPHPADEARDEPVPIAAPKKEPHPVDITQYKTRDEMSARRRELDAEITRMAELPGVLAVPEQDDWDSKTEERKALDEAITAWDKRLAFADSIASKEENRVAYEVPQVLRRPTETDIYDLDAVWSRSRSPEQRSQTLRDNAMRSVEQATFPHPSARPDEARSHIANLLDYRDNAEGELAQRVLMTGSPLYRRTFNKVVQGQHLTAEEQRAGALAVVGTTTTGGYMVPYVFDPTIVPIGAWTSVNPYRQACRVETIVGGNVWQAVAAGAVTPTRGAEAAIATEAGPVFEAPSITVKRVQTLITYSIETEQDRPDIASEMARLIQEGKDTEEENSFTNGDGTSDAPFGMMAVNAKVNGFWTIYLTAGNSTALVDLYGVEAALMLRHRMNAAWFMSRAMIRAIQALETAGGQLFGGDYYNRVGYPTLTPSGNTGLRLLNYPIWEVPSAVYHLTTTKLNQLAFGDPKQFIIVDRVGMNVETIPHIFTGAVPTGQRGLYAMWRNSAATFGAVGAATTGGIRLQIK